MAEALSSPKPLEHTPAFTLIELLLTLAIFIILSAIGLASWSHLRVHWKSERIIGSVREGLGYARAQAIIKKQPVSYCGSADGRHCDGKWSKGQVVRLLRGGVLKTYPTLPFGFSLGFLGNLSRNSRVIFTSQGFTKGQQGHFILCASKPPKCLRLIVHFSGQVVEP